MLNSKLKLEAQGSKTVLCDWTLSTQYWHDGSTSSWYHLWYHFPSWTTRFTGSLSVELERRLYNYLSTEHMRADDFPHFPWNKYRWGEFQIQSPTAPMASRPPPHLGPMFVFVFFSPGSLPHVQNDYGYSCCLPPPFLLGRGRKEGRTFPSFKPLALALLSELINPTISNLTFSSFWLGVFMLAYYSKNLVSSDFFEP